MQFQHISHAVGLGEYALYYIRSHGQLTQESQLGGGGDMVHKIC